MDAKGYFLEYVKFDTQSDEHSASSPSTGGQTALAEYLVQQLHRIGLQNVSLDANGYVMAALPGNAAAPAIGFIAHLDTSPDAPGKGVDARVVNYGGGDIVLNKGQNITLSPSMFPELNGYIGQDLIVADGTTLLGADDKAGIAAIMAAMEHLAKHPEIKHGAVRVAFTPDEEIGRGADRFDVEKFGCEWAYTVDGGAIGEIECENFNAVAADVTFRGRNIHPGYAKGKMLNAMLMANEFISQVPPGQRPECTEGREGFFHLASMRGTVEEASLSYIIRDHDRALFEGKKSLLRAIAQRMNQEYANAVSIKIRDQYHNMREKIEPCKQIVDIAVEAMEKCGVKPLMQPVRGGTDGARLSFLGLPCPNIFAGGHNFHGRYEYLPVNSLEKSKETIIKIIEITACRQDNRPSAI